MCHIEQQARVATCATSLRRWQDEQCWRQQLSNLAGPASLAASELGKSDVEELRSGCKPSWSNRNVA